MNDKDYTDSGSIGRKIIRYGRVSATMAGLATKLASDRYLGLSIEKEEHARQITQALGNLRGPIVKVGQILATIPEAIPKEYADELRGLQNNAPPMSWSFVRRRMKTELGPDWQNRFQSFEQDAAAAASLGQVHKAIHMDGHDLACKLQYPDMISAIDADLDQIKIIFSMFERYDKSVQTKHIHSELADRLHEELDYKREARFTKLYGHILKDEKNIHVPEIYDDLSTDRLLTGSWLEGRPILDFRDADQETCNQLAVTMFKAWYVPVYYYGLIHGDPHMGNYSVRVDHGLNLLDFGCMRVFRPEFIKGVIDLYHALQNNDRDACVAAYHTWGFEGLSNDVIDTLSLWARFLYGPILEDKKRPIGVVDEGMYGRETAMKVHQELRRHGGITVPREFVFMDRAALGLGSVFMHLRAEVNWYQLFNEMIADFDIEKLRQRQSTILEKFEITV